MCLGLGRRRRNRPVRLRKRGRVSDWESGEWECREFGRGIGTCLAEESEHFVGLVVDFEVGGAGEAVQAVC